MLNEGYPLGTVVQVRSEIQNHQLKEVLSVFVVFFFNINIYIFSQ